jgi:hypothetical protein
MILNPYRSMRLIGRWNLHVVQIALPIDNVRAMLPPGLALAPQQLTPEGTHPVRLYFTADLHATLSWPPGIDMLYNEQCFGVPFVSRVAQAFPVAPSGPYYYMPRLWLDDWVPTYGGLVFWGYEKRLANIEVAAEKEDEKDWIVYRVADRMTGIPQITARWQLEPGEPVRVSNEPNFAAQQAVMDQPVVSQVPWSMGPYQALAHFDMTWNAAIVQGIQAEVEIHQPFIPGLPVARFPRTRGIADDPFGSYVLTCPWELGLAYGADLADWMQLTSMGAARSAPY